MIMLCVKAEKYLKIHSGVVLMPVYILSGYGMIQYATYVKALSALFFSIIDVTTKKNLHT